MAVVREYVWLAIIGIVLIAGVLIVRANSEAMAGFIDQHPYWGTFLYTFLNIVNAVIAPGVTLPLVPVAVQAWGRDLAALLTIGGWTAGSLMAFSIARRWGAPIVRRLTSMQRLRRMKKYIPENLFWSIVLLRAALPMDVISYLLGLFTDIGWTKYTAATALGLVPPAFVLAYLGELPQAYEIIAFGVGLVVVVGYVMIVRRRHKSGTRA